MPTPTCLACGRTQSEVPLITLSYQDRSFLICPQHLPVLIHNPQALVGKLPGAEGMAAAEHED
ncbi:MAG: hypothetical protein MUE68_05145 [Bacteroidetes bacterium]|jgi:hypothetical protein|nr:hypothetical protein [Bacteroidota bacterium]MCU0453022.1 hypothetical protein [Bacteroidota bacterium]